MRSKQSPSAKSQSGKYWRETDARAALAAWKRSGSSLARFAREHDIPVEKLHRWKRRLSGTLRTVSFHQVKLVPPARDAASGIEVVVRGGRRVAVRAGFDAELLRQVVGALESWSC